MEKFDLYWITWKNQEALGKKIEDLTDSDFTIRPGLILDKDIIVTIAKITKHEPRLIFKNEYKIIKWSEAGLAVPSTIRFSKKELIPAYLITEANKIGHLLDEDIQQIIKLKLIESLKESKEEDILKARSIIADQIRGEWDADKGYTKAAADLAELKDIDTKEAQDMMLDIASEEHVHVGELETAYNAFDPKLFDELEDGHNEADEKAEPANALDYDIGDEPVADGLDIEEDYKKGVNNKTLKDVMMSVANSIAPEQILPDTAYDVHHLDYNNTNNEIYNISIMPAKLHRSFHAKARYLTPQEKDNLFKNTPEYYENCIKIGDLILSFIKQQGPKAELAENCLKTIKDTLKESDYLGDEEECSWCHEKFPKSEIEFEKDFGPLCHKCIQAIKSHEGKDSLDFEESLIESKLVEAFKNIDKMEIVVSILNYITGKDYNYLLEKERSIGGTRLLPKYIIYHMNHNHENNVLDNLYILNRADHQKYHQGLINFDEIEKINLGQPVSEFLKDISTENAQQLESLLESVESDQIEKIENFIERVYEMRKEGIAESEYSIKNLVFKELRNKGYLDDLREIKLKLKSKDLSLEEDKK